MGRQLQEQLLREAIQKICKVYCIQKRMVRKSLMSLYTRGGLAVFLFSGKFFLRGQNSEKATLCSNIILTKMLKYEKRCLKTVKKL